MTQLVLVGPWRETEAVGTPGPERSPEVCRLLADLTYLA